MISLKLRFKKKKTTNTSVFHSCNKPWDPFQQICNIFKLYPFKSCNLAVIQRELKSSSSSIVLTWKAVTAYPQHFGKNVFWGTLANKQKVPDTCSATVLPVQETQAPPSSILKDRAWNQLLEDFFFPQHKQKTRCPNNYGRWIDTWS